MLKLENLENVEKIDAVKNKYEYFADDIFNEFSKIIYDNDWILNDSYFYEMFKDDAAENGCSDVVKYTKENIENYKEMFGRDVFLEYVFVEKMDDVMKKEQYTWEGWVNNYAIEKEIKKEMDVVGLEYDLIESDAGKKFLDELDEYCADVIIDLIAAKFSG